MFYSLWCWGTIWLWVIQNRQVLVSFFVHYHRLSLFNASSGFTDVAAMSNRENFASHSKCHRRGFLPTPTPGVDDICACAFCCHEYTSDSRLCGRGKFGQFLSHWLTVWLADRHPLAHTLTDPIGLIKSPYVLATLGTCSSRPPIGVFCVLEPIAGSRRVFLAL